MAKADSSFGGGRRAGGADAVLAETAYGSGLGLRAAAEVSWSGEGRHRRP